MCVCAGSLQVSHKGESSEVGSPGDKALSPHECVMFIDSGRSE